MRDRKHFVIVGGGLAGTFMAVRLLQAKQTVSLIDDKAPQSASRVAAGLFNIITGRFGAKSWMGETLLAKVRTFLARPEFEGAQQFVFDTEIYRPFKTIEEYNKWQARTVDPGFSHLIRLQEEVYRPDLIHNPIGGIWILPCGWIDLAGFINWMLDWLIQQDGFQYFHTQLAYDQLDVHARLLNVDGAQIKFDEVIFCEGYRINQNPWFPRLRIIPNKGETLLIESEAIPSDFVISKKIYLIPVGNQQFVVGSTYYNHFIDILPSEKGKAEICTHLEKAIKVPYRILEHKAGIRPTTPDRKPLMGTHKELEHLHVFTGFGTKGVLLAPYFSEKMSDFILDKTNVLPKEVDWRRFKK